MTVSGRDPLACAKFAAHLCLAGFLIASHLSAQNTITTLAGTDYLFPGDGKAAVNAPLGLVGSVALDPNGNPVFADPGNCVVARLNPNGLLTVLAGNGLQGFSGDGGPATGASLNTPQAVAYDAAGNLYIADTGNGRIRMVTPGGTISTIAGNGQSTDAGEGVAALQASLSNPIALAIDPAGFIYVSDILEVTGGSLAARIRRITPAGVISTIAGTGQPGPSPDGVQAKAASLGDVEDIALDSKGNLYLAEFSNNKIRMIDANGILTTVAGDGRPTFAGDGGAATRASLYNPGGIALDSSNNLYIADTNNFCIRMVNSQGIISTIAGIPQHGGFSGDGGSALNARLGGGFGLTVDTAGDVYLTDTENMRVREVRSNGTITTVAGNGNFRAFVDGTPASNAFLFAPQGVRMDGNGNIFIADTENSSVRRIAKDGTISTIAGNGKRQFGGDGGPASLASLDDPASVRPDAAGNLYIADSDNEAVRKVAPDGTISTVAGNGFQGYSGDNGLATNATLNTPEDMALDNSGNLYISDFGNQRIRRVSPNGTITTVAGNGQAKYAGDGGLATQASLNGPRGLAFDPAGNLYIADYYNARIRRLSFSDGTMSTIAGGGTRVFTTGSIPATQAALAGPTGIVIDGSGNVYFADALQSRIYVVSAATSNLSIVAGNGNYGFSGDGGPATLAQFDGPYGLALDTAGNLMIADSFNNRIREILVSPPGLQTSPASLSFTAKSAGGLTDSQSVSISSSSAGLLLLYSVTANTTSGGAWLKASVSSGTTPAAVQVQADPTGLDPGAYQGSIVISAPNANPATRTVTVSLTVQAPDQPKLGTGSTFLTYSFVQGAAASSQTLTVLNQGGGSLTYSVSAATNTGGGWLTVSPASGTATPTQSSPVNIQADPTGLDPGTYTGTVTITAGTAGTVAIPVTMTVAPVTRLLLLSQTGLKFNAVFQGGAPLPQTLAVINAGQGGLNWTAQANTLPAGGTWLSVTPPSGTSTAGALIPPSLTVAIDASSLAPGEYYGQIQVSSPDANNSPQSVTVVLDVLATGSAPGPEVSPTGLVFTGAAGTSPGSQNVFISNLISTDTSYASGRVTQDGANWFVDAPTNGIVSPNAPARVVVQPDFTNLAPGTYNGVLTLLFGNVVRTVNILSIVTGNASSSGTGAAGALEPHASGCSAKQLQMQFIAPSANATVMATQPVTVRVSATDNCGTSMQSGDMKVTFSNQDPAVALQNSGNGIWEGTWQPRSAVPSQVTLVVNAESGQTGTNGASVLGGATLTVTVQPDTAPVNTPVVSSGVLNAASQIANPLVPPGGLITIYGQGLSDVCNAVSGPPYDIQNGGTQVFLDNSPLALLYTCDGQINAQVPYNLAANTPHQLSVHRIQVLSVPVGVSVAPAQPAIFTVGQNGLGPADIFPVGPDGSVGATPVSDAAPAKAGDIVAILCTGVGLVSPPVDVGASPPASPASLSVSPVLVSIGGVQAQVLGAALAPNMAGVYRVLAAVPSGVTPGDVPVILTVAGQNSPVTATMAVAGQ